jgi:hypothetical protein
MRYFQHLAQYTIENDIDGFKIPYRICGNYEKEVLTQKYFQLKNQSKNPLWKRCNEIAYGGLGIRNQF